MAIVDIRFIDMSLETAQTIVAGIQLLAKARMTILKNLDIRVEYKTYNCDHIETIAESLPTEGCILHVYNHGNKYSFKNPHDFKLNNVKSELKKQQPMYNSNYYKKPNYPNFTRSLPQQVV
jgi:hypothetical protein